MLVLQGFQNGLSWGEPRILLTICHAPRQYSPCLSLTVPDESPSSLLFKWLHTAPLFMAFTSIFLLFPLNFPVDGIVNILVCNFQSWSVYGEKLWLMCKLCPALCFALFMFIIHCTEHFLAEGREFWNCIFPVVMMPLNTFNNLPSWILLWLH